MRKLIISLALCFAAQGNTFGAEVAIDPAKVLGKYQGQMEQYAFQRLEKYDFTVDIFKFDAGKKELSQRIEGMGRTSWTSVSECKITNLAPIVEYSCAGENWHVEYKLDGDVLKGEGVTKKGFPYKVNVKKIVAPSSP